jgi:hypothetical protein
MDTERQWNVIEDRIAQVLLNQFVRRQMADTPEDAEDAAVELSAKITMTLRSGLVEPASKEGK